MNSNSKLFKTNFLVILVSFLLFSSSLLPAQTYFQPNPDQCYRLTNKLMGEDRSLSVAADGNRIVMAETNRFSKDQLWKILQIEDGIFQLYHQCDESRKVIGVIDDASHENMQLKDIEHSDDQRWVIEQNRGGYHRLINLFDHKSLDCDAEINGNLAWLSQRNEASGQYWKITPAKLSKEPELPNNPSAGDMAYFNGQSWIPIAKGSKGQVLKMSSGMPTWTNHRTHPPQTNNGGASATYNVGDFAHGGVVFWVDETRQQGLVCAIYDLGNRVRWGEDGPEVCTKAMREGVYGGSINTERITDAYGGNKFGNHGYYAASICSQFDGGGYGDWYLPSKGELNLMCKNKDAINKTAIANGGEGFESDYYWSSTEKDGLGAWCQNFDNCYSQNMVVKSDKYHIRAVRAF